MAFLYHLRPDGTPAEFWPVGEKPLVVGRGQFADAFIDDDSLSRSHFLIVKEANECFLVDLHSANGVTVNGIRMTAHKLRPNDIIAAGASTFSFSDLPADIFPVIVPSLLLEPHDSAGAEDRAG